jgi:Flp pilus assembly pilin Flp
MWLERGQSTTLQSKLFKAWAGPGREKEGEQVSDFLRKAWSDEQGQDIAEYAVMLAVILVIVVGTVRLIGGNANNTFSSVASSIQ